eukprot:RCo046100
MQRVLRTVAPRSVHRVRHASFVDDLKKNVMKGNVTWILQNVGAPLLGFYLVVQYLRSALGVKRLEKQITSLEKSISVLTAAKDSGKAPQTYLFSPNSTTSLTTVVDKK